MAQQGGLGRGLASLIPKKSTIASSGKEQKKNSQKKTANKKGKSVKKDVVFDGGLVGETNYFGGRAGEKITDITGDKKAIGNRRENKRTGSGNNGLKDDGEKVIALKSVVEVAVEEIVPNPYQPRTNFEPNKLQELADSIKEHGIIQPLVVSYGKEGGYELIAGERRLEAAKLAGLKTVPVVTKRATEQNKAEWALIENIQRHNLNPIEEAQAYEKMQEEFGLTQEEIAQKVGKSRSAVANVLRLLKLPKEIKEALAVGKITEGHGRTILALSDEKKQMELFKSILKDGLNVRQVEGIAKKAVVSKNYRRQKEIDPDILDLENKMADSLKTKVKIKGVKENGQIVIDYYSVEELGEIGKKLTENK